MDLSEPPPGALSAEVVARLRRLARGQPAPAGTPTVADATATTRCDLCGAAMSEDHRHLLDVGERQILCACEPCIAMRAGEGGLRPTGTRFQVPIGLAFFLVSEVAGGVVALYPSPAGATESELYLEAWNELVAANPVLTDLEPDVEALVVNRLVDPHAFAIVPIDRCYELVGMIKATWEGISGGDAVQNAVEAFFARLPPSRSAA